MSAEAETQEGVVFAGKKPATRDTIRRKILVAVGEAVYRIGSKGGRLVIHTGTDAPHAEFETPR
jgi:hypothetical protein